MVQRQSNENLYTNLIAKYGFALIIGLVVGYRTLPQLLALPYLIVSSVIIYSALQGRADKALSLFPFLIYTEMFIRAYVLFIPYLFIQFLYVIVFGIMFLKQGNRLQIHSRSFVFLVLFVLIEIINSFRSVDADNARGLAINSLVVAVLAIWASSSIILPTTVNKVLQNLKYASIYLCGIILARYLKGDVSFSAHSGSEGTNGLAPVQISGYLGFSCTVFFFSIMDNAEKRFRWLNIILICITSTVMLFSFSRGGLYFLGIMMALYFLFNRDQMKSYLILLLLIPVALIVFQYVNERTNGLIEQRYEQEGSSGRDMLVQAGLEMFMNEPLAGVGTGNFNTEVLKRRLYWVSSGAHNEFIRVAAEDGILGLTAYLGFYIVLTIEILRRRRTQREFAFYFLIFFCLISIHNGLKISLQPLLILLAIGTPSVVTIKRKRAREQYQPQLTP